MSYNYTPHSTFKKIWNNSNVEQKKRLIKTAELDHIISDKQLNWNQIESNFQSKIRDAIRKDLNI